MPFEDRQGTVRFKLTALSPDGKFMKLYRSQIMPLDGFSEPNQIGRELIDKIGPYQEHVSQMFDVLGIVDYTTCVEEADYQGQWFAKAALYLTKEKGCDLFFCHVRLIDVAPTLCHLLGIQPPAQSQGAIIYDLLEGHEMVRERPRTTPQYEPTRKHKKWWTRFREQKGLLAEESIPC